MSQLLDKHLKEHRQIDIPGSYPLLFNEIDTPSAPGQNKLKVYAKDDGSGESAPYYQSDAGIEYNLSGGGGGATTLSALLDVQITSVTDRDVLQYVSADGFWENKQPSWLATEGGTGFTSYTTGQLLYASSSSALSRLGIGTSGQFLGVSAGLPAWGSVAFSNLTGNATVAQGGTNITSYTTGDLLYASSSSVLSKLGIGANGKFLTVSSGLPSWGDAVDLTNNQTVGGIKTFTSFPLTPSSSPSTDYQVANKIYVDTLFTSGSRFVGTADAATTTTLPANTYNNGALGVGATLTGNANGAFPTIDGVAAALNNLYLVKNEATTSRNGFYKLTTVGTAGTPYILTRDTEYDQAAECVAGTFFNVLSGTVNGNTQWAQITTGAIVMGTTALVFTQLSAPQVYTASLGVQKVGNDFRSDFTANDGLKLSGNSLTVAYDNSSIGIVSNLLAVKALGVTNAMLAGSIDLASKVTGTLPVTNGGTQLSVYAQGDILYASAVAVLSKLAKDTNATRYLSNTGASNNPAWAQVALTTGVSGVLPEANGGTNQATYAKGDIIYASALNTLSKLGIGTAGQILQADASGVPIWAAGGGGGGAGVNSLTYAKSLDVNTTAVTITNSVVETTIYTYAFSAGQLGTNKLIKVNLAGTYTNTSGANRIVTVKVKLGGTTILSKNTPNIATATTAKPWSIEAYLMNDGSASSQKAFMWVGFETGVEGSVLCDDRGVGTVNTAGAVSLTVTVQHNVAAPTISLSRTYAQISMVNATDTVGAPSDASYVTLAVSGDLTNERVLTGTANQITLTDGGAGGNLTLSIPYNAKLGASTAGPSSLDFFEDADNGSNKTTLIGTASMSSDFTITLPAATGTVAVSATAPVTLSSLGAIGVSASSTTAAGVIEIAVQAEMEAGTDNTRCVTPAVQQFHPGHPKCWAMVTVATGTPTLQTSYNITSIADTGTGLLTVTIATDFSSANWSCLATVERVQTALTVANLEFVAIRNATLAVGSVVLECWDNTVITANQVDPKSWHMVGLGDQA